MESKMQVNRRIADKITEWSMGQGCDNDSEEFQVISYGILLTIEMVYKAAVLLTFGALFDCFAETIAFMLAFCGLRKYAGGFHMQTSLGCMGMMTVFWFVSMVVSQIHIAYPVQISLFAGTFLLVLVYAPRYTSNNPITEARIRRRKKLLALVYVTALAAVSFLINRERVGNVIVIAAAIEALTIIHRKVEW